MARRVTQTRRSNAEVARFFDGLDLVEPGITTPHHWNPGPDEPNQENDMPDAADWPGSANAPPGRS